jgi:uncharacterized membrane-anchored protein
LSSINNKYGNNNNWNEWSNKVLSDLDQYNQDIQNLYEKINELKIELAVMKAKAAVWGAIGGVCISAVISIGVFISSRIFTDLIVKIME